MVPPHPDVQIRVGIFGGSGFYSFLDDVQEVPVQTPYGPPSATVTVGQVKGRSVGFMPRHGADHSLPPHKINYRANVWAMKHLGVTDMILPCAAGSLDPDIAPGSFVIADQAVDRTSGRDSTFYDGPRTVHVAFADPYDAEMRSVVLQQAGELGIEVHDGGTIVVINGPRFSTRAESQYYARQGWQVIGMTQFPEVTLCRELEMAALNISLITDYDVGLSDDPGIAEVTHAEVLKTFEANNEHLRDLLFAIIPALPLSADRPALHALDDVPH